MYARDLAFECASVLIFNKIRCERELLGDFAPCPLNGVFGSPAFYSRFGKVKITGSPTFRLLAGNFPRRFNFSFADARLSVEKSLCDFVVCRDSLRKHTVGP